MAEEDAAPESFSSVWQRVRDKSCPVHSVTLAGNQRTKEHVILREMQPVAEARTLEEVRDALVECSSRLKELDIFRSVDILADSSQEGGPHTADLLITVQEKGVVSLDAGTFVQGAEGSVEGKLRLNNALGYAEQLEAVATAGSASSRTVSVSLVQRQLAGRPARAEGRLGQTLRSLQHHSSCSERLRSLGASLQEGPHRAEFELAWRQLSDAERTASPAVRALLGHSLKSALRYSHTRDHRDSASQPSTGWAARGTLELAGLAPTSVRFLRADCEAQKALPLPLPLLPGAALALSLRLGVLLPLAGGGGGRGAPGGGGTPACGPAITHLSDRFFLGGADSADALRGFRTKGVGPSDARRPRCADDVAAAGAAAASPARDALGGDLLCAATAAVTFPLPHEALRAAGVHGHVFVNAGTLLPLAAASELTSSLRAAAGAGVVLPTRLGRLEVNYCLLLRTMQHDRAKAGIQVGLRPDPL